MKRLSVIRHFEEAITSSLDLRIILNILLSQIIEHFDVDAVDILLLNSHTKILEITSRLGFHTGALQYTQLHLGESYAGKAALERCVVHISDLAETPGGLSQSKLLADEGFHTYSAVPLIAKGQVKGILEIFHRKVLGYDLDWEEFLVSLAAQAAIAIDNAQLFQDAQRSNLELGLAYDATLEGWAKALELRDKKTEGHSQRVTKMTVRLGQAVGMKDEELVHLRRGALLHDIGKMGIPDSILLKPGPLTEEEWEIMRKHPVYAFEMISSIPYLHPALDIPYSHHEKWDGTGYPQGLKGEKIPLAARVFALVDVWDALSSDRPYRPRWSEEKIREYIRSLSAIHFDPALVDAFFNQIDSF
jgi:response regulator RpfG family c-di-GMP phosphodiesterase